MWVYERRLYLAAGGHPTLFYTLSAGWLGYTLGGFSRAELVPQGSHLTSQAGAKAFLARTGLGVAVPALFGFFAGTAAFGNREEMANLLRNAGQYR